MNANPIWRPASPNKAGNDEDAMTRKFQAASKLAVLLAATALVAVGATSASAQSKPRYDKDGRAFVKGSSFGRFGTDGRLVQATGFFEAPSNKT